ncbi:CbrC family protein [Bacillus sp. FSL M8-0049]
MNHHFLHNGGLYDVTTFKYNPDPVSLNVIKKEHTTCPVCEKERDAS